MSGSENFWILGLFLRCFWVAFGLFWVVLGCFGPAASGPPAVHGLFLGCFGLFWVVFVLPRLSASCTLPSWTHFFAGQIRSVGAGPADAGLGHRAQLSPPFGCACMHPYCSPICYHRAPGAQPACIHVSVASTSSSLTSHQQPCLGYVCPWRPGFRPFVC